MDIRKRGSIEEAIEFLTREGTNYLFVRHRLDPGDVIKPHYHPEANEWVVIDNGIFTAKAGRLQKTFDLRLRNKALVIFVPRGEIHSLSAQSEIFYFVFRDKKDKTIYEKEDVLMKDIKVEVEKLPEVPNVCNLRLREVWTNSKTASLAYVIVEPDEASRLHKNNGITELYYILNGEGIMWVGDERFEVKKNTLIEIKPSVPHKLENTGSIDLEHLVISTPAFSPESIELIDD